MKLTRKNLSQCHLSTTNPTWTEPGANPGLRSERPTTNCLSHGTALATGLNPATNWIDTKPAVTERKNVAKRSSILNPEHQNDVRNEQQQ
jgi:hypothetical protein